VLLKKVSPNLWIVQGHALRMFLDLQFRSIVHALSDSLPSWPSTGHVLDFGAGQKPYRHLIPPGWSYTSLDSEAEGSDLKNLNQLATDQRFDRILLLEVLEHIQDPKALLKTLRKRLQNDGELVLTVPFSARIHPCPSDFLRWTPEALTSLLESSGFEILEFRYRGSDFATWISKGNYFFARRMGPNLWSLLGLLLAPLFLLGLLWCQRRAETLPTVSEDPLGFFVRARASIHESGKSSA